MCGRYTITKDPAVLQGLIKFTSKIPFFTPRYNIAPTQQAPVIVQDNNKPALKLLKWGLIPPFAGTESVGTHNINARVESLSHKPSFRSALKQRRCLVPADGFFEWEQTGKPRQPFRIMQKDGTLFCFAGLWEKWIRPPSKDGKEPAAGQVVESFTIITQDANQAIHPLHDRMPLIIDPAKYKCWLDETPESEAYLTAMREPSVTPLKIYPVSTMVNSARTDSPECIKPVELNRDLFEQKWWEDGFQPWI